MEFGNLLKNSTSYFEQVTTCKTSFYFQTLILIDKN